MTDGLAGRTALVTGGTGGLGRHMVRELLESGATVHLTWIDPDELEEVRPWLEEAAGGPDALHLHQADVTDAGAVDDLIRRVAEASGPPEILLNLVGGFALAPLEETDPATWRRMLEINATSAFLVSRAAAEGMKAAGWGRIVNVASFPALHGGQSGLGAYGASKAAVLNLTGTLSRELAGHGVTVNALVPSIIDTPGNRAAMPDADRSTWLPPEEIARVARFLVGPDARIVTGASITLSLG